MLIVRPLPPNTYRTLLVAHTHTVQNKRGILEAMRLLRTQAVQNNGTLFMHVFIVKAGNSPDPADKDRYSKVHTIHKYRR